MKNSYSQNEQEKLKNLGRRVRFFRNKANLSQEQLSFLCELDRTYIGSVERGERNIAILNLCKLAKALYISISELVDWENE